MQLAPVPADIQACFLQMVGAPPKRDLTAKEVAHLIAMLKASEMRKSHCGVRLITWYETQKDIFEKGNRRWAR